MGKARLKSDTQLNVRNKPSALGKIGSIKVGDRFIDSELNVTTVVKIDYQSNLPFHTETQYAGWVGAGNLTYTYIKKNYKKL
jgi:hypothetical protein